MSSRHQRDAAARTITPAWLGFCLGGLMTFGCGEAEATAAQTTGQNEIPPAASPAQAAEPGVQASPSERKAAQAPPKLLITLDELSLRRDLWPSHVKITQEVRLPDGEVLAVGRELPLYEMMGVDVAIDMGADLVQIPGSDTDILERASATMALLTPEQLALREQDLPSRPELWPLEVKLSRTLQFSGGTQVAAGTMLIFRKFNGYSLNVYDRKLKDHFQCEIHETDAIARARERMRLPEAERKPFFVRALAAAVDAAADPAAGAGLESSDFVLVYQGRATARAARPSRPSSRSSTRAPSRSTRTSKRSTWASTPTPRTRARTRRSSSTPGAC